jgi:predicted ATPase
MLLLLDNAEHVAGFVHGVLDAAVRSAPNLRVLLTSRRSLDAAWEVVYRLEPLPSEDAKALLRSFTAAPAPEELVASLGGVPLALTLAGPQLARGVPAEDVVEAASEGLHRSIDVSWALLEAGLQQLLATFSVFRGAVGLAALVAVSGGDELELLDDVGELVNWGLVTAHPGDEKRFSLHRLTREFARARLDDGAWVQAARAHAAHFARHARERSTGYSDRRSAACAADRAELRAAVDRRALLDGDSAALCAIGLAMITFSRGPLEDGVRASLSVLGSTRDRTLRARLQFFIGVCRVRQGRVDQGRASLLACARTCGTGSRGVAAAALTNLAKLALMRRRPAHACRLGALGLRHAEATDFGPSIAVATSNLGFLLAEIGRLQDAREMLLRARRLHRDLGGRSAEADALSFLAELAEMSGDSRQAAAYCREALNAGVLLHGSTEVNLLLVLSSAELGLEHTEAAVEAAERAIVLADTQGDGRMLGVAVGVLGAAVLDRDGGCDASPLLQEALELSSATPGDPIRAWLFALLGLALVDGGKDGSEEAFRDAYAIATGQHGPGHALVCSLHARALAQLGHADEARRVLGLITRPDAGAARNAEIARGLLGEPERGADQRI